MKWSFAESWTCLPHDHVRSAVPRSLRHSMGAGPPICADSTCTSGSLLSAQQVSVQDCCFSQHACRAHLPLASSRLQKDWAAQRPAISTKLGS